MGLFNNSLQDLSFEYDELGNMLQRRDQSGQKDLTENFTYDGLNRLTSSHVVGKAAINISYDSFGNIINKSDVGTYSYGANGAGPHALTGVAGTTYNYDANGNMIADGARTITYTSYDMAQTIQTSWHTTEFVYGPDRARYKKVSTTYSTTEITYLFGSYQVINDAAGNLKEIRKYLPGNTLITYKQEPSAPLETVVQYLLTDHLGSVDVVVDDSGNVIEELSFDPWGMRRNPTSWENLNVLLIRLFQKSP